MKTNKLLILIMVIGLLASSCFACQAQKTHTAPHHSLENNNDFKVIWNVSDMRMNDSNRRPNMVGAPGRIIIHGWKSGDVSSDIIIGLDSANGEIAWKIPGAYGGYIITHGENLYRGTAGMANVQAYDTKNGKLFWETRLPWAHSTSDLFYSENKIFIYTNNDKFFILNELGEVLTSFQETSRTFLEIDGILYMEDNLAIKAVDVSSKTELWRQEIDDRYTHAPIFDNGTIFLRTWNTPTYIYSIDQYTGKVNWESSQDVLSNLYVLGGKIYFISFDGYLVTIDRILGVEISKVKFSPSFDLNNQISGYFISGDPINNILAVSFGDNTQIMGLKIANP